MSPARLKNCEPDKDATPVQPGSSLESGIYALVGAMAVCSLLFGLIKLVFY